MTQATRRDRGRTDQEIRAQARSLLVSDGPQAVTLRAIARELGITAPALYRYYSSREDLVAHLRADVCADLTAALTTAVSTADDPVARVLVLCRGFRSWALAHPQEFSLVFGSPSAGPPDLEKDSFGRVFLGVAGQVLATGAVPARPDAVPGSLREDLEGFRAELLELMSPPLSGEVLTVEVAHALLRCWVRLYGQVALEVFGQVPTPVTNTGALFESTLLDMLAEFGLS
ncbi:TetR/AcrR family transcriptional regulator [Actinokineospora bangkokensis]|uniref:TetR family transcriptional regulator n=1 Tax=Actinokineospora bangkokensis TaxID=1193682 RepID=A0A1Q9LG94_9PSEU|nr:TetR/AcrR family transcriptional regulator [Actinokineospora bangkokensis]OLR91034.1 TetR family transcriptional regulator [Actinokineospora bangkokensis]